MQLKFNSEGNAVFSVKMDCILKDPNGEKKLAYIKAFNAEGMLFKQIPFHNMNMIKQGKSGYFQK